MAACSFQSIITFASLKSVLAMLFTEYGCKLDVLANYTVTEITSLITSSPGLVYRAFNKEEPFSQLYTLAPQKSVFIGFPDNDWE